MMCSNSTAAGVARNIVTDSPRAEFGWDRRLAAIYVDAMDSRGVVDVIAARAPDLYDLKAIEHT